MCKVTFIKVTIEPLIKWHAGFSFLCCFTGWGLGMRRDSKQFSVTYEYSTGIRPLYHLSQTVLK